MQSPGRFTRLLLAAALQIVEQWQRNEARRVDWVRPEAGSLLPIAHTWTTPSRTSAGELAQPHQPS